MRATKRKKKHMNRLLNKVLTVVLVPAALLLLPPMIMAGEDSAAQAQASEIRASEIQAKERELKALAVAEEAEGARLEAEIAREKALSAAEMAREAARMNSEIAREEGQMEAEMERAREELSRTHRELSEATREVARAHRDLARSDRHRHREIIRHVNLGDRAVIGVVLGAETEDGIKIIGVSPDGPAERAGLQQGDKLVSISGIDLTGAESSARQSIYDVMGEAEDGEELAVVAMRDGETLELTVTAEQREPRSWQSVIRIPEVEVIEGEPGSTHLVVETIEIPNIDHEALSARIEALTERLEARKFLYVSPDGENFDYDEDFDHGEFDFDEFSDFGGHAMEEANIWFGMPRAHGLELTSINEGLGTYFKTDRGVLVIEAREKNAYQLESGDVILEIESNPVDSPSDVVRALREVEPGSEIDISIKRNRRDKSLTVVVPENRLGHLGYFRTGKSHQ